VDGFRQEREVLQRRKRGGWGSVVGEKNYQTCWEKGGKEMRANDRMT